VIDHPLVTGIANLSLDHQQFLGNGLTDIAAEKAGIAKPDVPLITQLYPPAVAGRIGKAAHGSGAPWLPRGGSWDAIVRQSQLHYCDEQGELRLPLPRLLGRYQAMNAALAIAMLRHQEALRVPISALSAAMGWADWPARLQHLAPDRSWANPVLARRRPQSVGRARWPGSSNGISTTGCRCTSSLRA
jgi:dihydrofolate synthase/folylpolyglutamate synthase